MARDTKPRDPERIYLEPWPYSPEGRLWSEENVWPLYTWPPEPEGESERASGVEYIRSDLHDAEIARLTRELDEVRKLIRELAAWPGLVWTGTRVVCAYCYATDRYGVEHDRACLIERARRVLAKDTEASDGE